MLSQLKEAGLDVLAVGKIYDIFAGDGVTDSVRTKGNLDGLNKTLDYMERDFTGLCFVNLVDYDMLYGHRNDVDGYAKALTEFDTFLPRILEKLKEELIASAMDKPMELSMQPVNEKKTGLTKKLISKTRIAVV